MSEKNPMPAWAFEPGENYVSDMVERNPQLFSCLYLKSEEDMSEDMKSIGALLERSIIPNEDDMREYRLRTERRHLRKLARNARRWKTFGYNLDRIAELLDVTHSDVLELLNGDEV